MLITMTMIRTVAEPITIEVNDVLFMTNLLDALDTIDTEINNPTKQRRQSKRRSRALFGFMNVCVGLTVEGFMAR